jgi:hypothetical protein
MAAEGESCALLGGKKDRRTNSVCIAGVGKDCGIYVDVEFWNVGNLTAVVTNSGNVFIRDTNLYDKPPGSAAVGRFPFCTKVRRRRRYILLQG